MTRSHRALGALALGAAILAVAAAAAALSERVQSYEERFAERGPGPGPALEPACASPQAAARRSRRGRRGRAAPPQPHALLPSMASCAASARFGDGRILPKHASASAPALAAAAAAADAFADMSTRRNQETLQMACELRGGDSSPARAAPLLTAPAVAPDEDDDATGISVSC